MKAQFTFLTGARAGQTSIFGQAYIAIGRHPESTLQFDADQDLDVSGRHAGVALEGDLYVLRDLGSTNGTFVNGKRLTADHVLATKDVIRFGPNGPQLEFTAIGEARRSPVPPVAAPAAAGTVVFGGAAEAAAPAAPAPPPPPPPPPKADPPAAPAPRRTPGPGTTTRIQAEVARRTAGARRTTYVLFGLLLLVSGAYLWQSARTGQELVALRAELQQRVDSLVTRIGTLSTGSEGLQAALDSVRGTAEQLQRQLAAAPTDAALIEDLRRRLDQAVRQQRMLAGAATLDATGIAAANKDAVALVFVEFASGAVYTGTAFAVQTDPNGALLVTNKHVVTDTVTGGIATRIGVVFEGTRQNFKADLVRLHGQADLALLRVSIHRGVPAVTKLADSAPVPVGTPAAILGFPLGLDLAGGHDWSQLGVASTLTLGTVSRVLPPLLQLDSYGAQGSSGSPIFDRQGRVIGVLYGGERGSGGRIIYSVPVRFVHQLIAGD